MAKSKATNGQPGHYNATPATRTDGDESGFEFDSKGNLLISQSTLSAGEDLTNDTQKVEERFSYNRTVVSALVKSEAGFIHTVTFSQDNASGPNAGTVVVWDGTTNSGTVIFKDYILGATHKPFTIILDVSFATGLYIELTAGTPNEAVVSSYR